MTRRSGSVLLAFNRSCPLYSVLYPKLHTLNVGVTSRTLLGLIRLEFSVS